MFKQSATSQTYRVPYYQETYPVRPEAQPNHLARIKDATHRVLMDRQARLDQVLDIDIPETTVFQKIAKTVTELVMGKSAVKQTPEATTFRQLIKRESELGAELLGPLPAYDHRKFYCYDDRMWIWHEERMNSQTGKYDVVTVSFNITDNGILKTYDEHQSHFLEGDELAYFTDYAEKYADTVRDQLYPQTRDAYALAS